MPLHTIVEHDTTHIKPYIDSVKQALSDEVNLRNVINGHNLFPLRLAELKANVSDNQIGSWTGDVYKLTNHPNLTFTVTANDKGYVTNIVVDGTSANSTATFYLSDSYSPFITTEELILSGCPSGGSDSTYALIANNVGYDTGNGLTIPASGQKGIYAIIIGANKTVSNLSFKPMLRSSIDTNTDFTPYVPTNSQLLSYKDNGILGAENLCDLSNNTSNGTATFTISDDGLLVTGSSSTMTVFFTSPVTADVVYSFCPDGGSDSTYRAQMYNATDNKWENRVYDSTFRPYHLDKGKQYIFYFAVIGSVTNLLYKPMIYLASDTNRAWVPHAMTNKELTDVAEQLDGKYIVDANKKVSVTADGTKTYAELLAELYTAYKIISDATANDFLRITDLYIGGYDNFIPSRLLQTNITLGIPSVLRFETVLGDAAQVITHYVTFGASSGTVRMTVVAATASGNSITTKNEEVPTSGKIITITYDLYKKIS